MQKVQLCNGLAPCSAPGPGGRGVVRLQRHEIRLGLIETALFKDLFMQLAGLIGQRREEGTKGSSSPCWEW